MKSLSAVGGDLNKIHLPDSSTMNEMVRRMEKFDEAPSPVEKSTTQHKVTGDVEIVENASNEEYVPKEVMHDTPGLMFAYARRTAEKVFGKDSIYR